MVSLSQFAAESVQKAISLKEPPNVEPAGVKSDGSTAIVVSPVIRDAPLDDIPATLRERGINPDDWIIERCVVNTWEVTAMAHGTPIVATNHQLKIFLRAKIELQLPSAARIDGPIYIPNYVSSVGSNEPFLVAFMSDQQGAYYDRNLHELTCEWLAYNSPSVVILGGDGTDLPLLSRFERNPANDVPVNDCIQSYYNMARDIMLAAKPDKAYALEGNHEFRLQKAVLAKLPDLFDLKRANETIPSLSVPYLCRLDELGIEYVAGYPHSSIVIPPAKLSFRHGWIVRQDSGQSALRTLEAMGHSVIVGHTHRQGITYKTSWDHNEKMTVHLAMEAGTMATTAGGLGYAVTPNWQQGFGVVQIWPDGYFACSNATYVDGVLLWQGQRYGNQLSNKKRVGR